MGDNFRFRFEIAGFIVLALGLIVGIMELRENSDQRKLANALLLLETLNPVASVEKVDQITNDGRAGLKLILKNETRLNLSVTLGISRVRHCASGEEVDLGTLDRIGNLFPLSKNTFDLWVNGMAVPGGASGRYSVDFLIVLESTDVDEVYQQVGRHMSRDFQQILRSAARKQNTMTFPSFYDVENGQIQVALDRECRQSM